MKKVFLSIVTVLTIVAASFTCASAQKKKKKLAAETRDVTIYIYEILSETTEFQWRLVPVKRKIFDYKPLGSAIKELLKGATEEEQKRNMIGFPDVLEFYSARIINKTARINFKFSDPPEYVEESWESSGFNYSDFVKAVEQTAKQFSGVEQVSICVVGVKNYTDLYFQKQVNALFQCSVKNK